MREKEKERKKETGIEIKKGKLMLRLAGRGREEEVREVRDEVGEKRGVGSRRGEVVERRMENPASRLGISRKSLSTAAAAAAR